MRFSLCLLAVLTLSVPAAAQSPLFEKGKTGLVYAYTIEPPFTTMGDDGKPTGFGNEVAVMTLEKMGLQVEGLVVEWATLVPGVKAGRYDFAQQMYITPKRCAEVIFTRPYIKGSSALLVPAGNPKGIRSYDDIKADPSIKLVLLSGAAENDYVARAEIPAEQIQVYPDIPAMQAAMMSGRGDVLNLSIETVTLLAGQSAGKLEKADATLPAWTTNYSAYAFRKEDADFVEAFNAASMEVIASEEFKTLMATVSPSPLDDLIPTAEETAEKICSN